MQRLIFMLFAGFLLFSLGFTRDASAASKMYTWTPSNLYKAATGTAYSAKINSGTAVTIYSKSGSRYKVSAGGKTGYIQAYNITGTKTKKTVYLSSKLYTTSSHTKSTHVLAVNKTVYVKESANSMYHVHVIGTNQNGWIYKSHFIKPQAKYTWTPSKLYTSATGTSYKKKVNSGKAITTFNESNGRYQVTVSGSTGYIVANNITGTLTKKTFYATSKLYTNSSHTKYTSVLSPNEQVYVKESGNGMYHVHVIGTNKNGWIYKSHFTKPATTPSSGTTSLTPPSGGTPSATPPSSGSSAPPSSGTTNSTPPSSGTTSSTTPSTTPSTTTLNGLDVSHYQSLTQTSFNNLKSDGYSFVIIKATEGTTYTDPQFYTYYKYARNAGLSVHAYHMIGNSAATADQQIAEAEHFNDVLSQTQAQTGYAFTGYAFEDVEQTPTNGIDSDWWENDSPACVSSFLNELQALGQTKVGVYAAYWYWTTYLENNTNTWPSDTKIWLARYNTTLGMNADIWQYTSTGTIDGISGNIDLDVSYDSNF
ncbi:glycoside hydrolase family 25 protein [Pullulanibacillus sp. KACC 23026]|uniref:glycoside hydrolase family 25 protein n=1 Tax=Pullulanibacillus sp. KACC 23026 TaxID=3028315 RepID=UPI0023AEFE2B|nr:glycoside hydrolase family 25 protein [Pullulanibacillus sp. KACC 23026]WEG13289.1 glycoside hydrolase family 25 protein [Pullulanibacillus sp. KACC 23026]